MIDMRILASPTPRLRMSTNDFTTGHLPQSLTSLINSTSRAPLSKLGNFFKQSSTIHTSFCSIKVYFNEEESHLRNTYFSFNLHLVGNIAIYLRN